MSEDLGTRPSWFVGAAYNRTEDQTPRFLAEGIWEIGYEDGKYGDLVRSMRPGDKIAIKSSYTRKRDLPFDNSGATVSVMAIMATGTITANPDDGKQVKVDWAPSAPPREWYFYTNRSTIWRVAPGEWMEDGLLSFAFDGRPQDMDRFRNEPFWRERFGETTLRSGYLYQIYAYLRSQTGRGDSLADVAEGLLLHPAIGETVDEAILVQGHCIRFATVDLAADSAAIRAQLLGLSIK